MILTTHDLSEAAVADYVVLLSGQVVATRLRLYRLSVEAVRRVAMRGNAARIRRCWR